VDWFSPQVAAENDAELICRLRHRNTEAMGELYNRYGKLLFTLILNIIGNRELAEDLLAETLLMASNQIQRFQNDSIALGPWLLILARNHALKFRAETGADGGNVQSRSKLEAPSLYSCGDSTCSNSLASDAARKSFLRLPDEDRLILELAWFEGMTIDEIALQLARPVEDVADSARGALARLREC
jgi:RNA polymerase sigma-70 factor (ECF subfamily)